MRELNFHGKLTFLFVRKSLKGSNIASERVSLNRTHLLQPSDSRTTSSQAASSKQLHWSLRNNIARVGWTRKTRHLPRRWVAPRAALQTNVQSWVLELHKIQIKQLYSIKSLQTDEQRKLTFDNQKHLDCRLRLLKSWVLAVTMRSKSNIGSVGLPAILTQLFFSAEEQWDP